AGTLRQAAARHLDRAAAGLGGQTRELHAATRLCLQRAGADLRTAARAVAHACERRLDAATNRLDQQSTRARLLDPHRVLARGFALVRDAAGRVVPGAARVTANQGLRVQWRDGHADVHVDSIRRDQP
ncbi:MAG: exodeoxyribonuclease VII large subunit, partial [Planctomycetota bacterium]